MMINEKKQNLTKNNDDNLELVSNAEDDHQIILFLDEIKLSETIMTMMMMMTCKFFLILVFDR